MYSPTTMSKVPTAMRSPVSLRVTVSVDPPGNLAEYLRLKTNSKRGLLQQP